MIQLAGMIRLRAFLLAIVFLMMPLGSVHAEGADLAIDAEHITFSESVLYAGDTVRIYARIRNVGDTDATASVLFYQGGMVIGQSQAVSLRVGGNADDVFVDFTLPRGTFNIRAVVQGSNPADRNAENDTAITPLYSTISDADRDGVIDDDDNCDNDQNASQEDFDHDGIGNVCDPDDDGDDVADATDPEPLNPAVSVAPVPTVVVAPVVAPVVDSTESNTDAPIDQPKATDDVADAAPTPASIAVDTVANAVATLGAPSSKLTTSPLAQFTSRQIDWRTYEFIAIAVPSESAQLSWDFGDGATSVQQRIVHAFAGPGTYVVTLATIDAAGNRLSDAQEFDVSFFHFDNPKVIGLIVMLVLVMMGFFAAWIALRKKYDQGALHE